MVDKGGIEKAFDVVDVTYDSRGLDGVIGNGESGSGGSVGPGGAISNVKGGVGDIMVVIVFVLLYGCCDYGGGVSRDTG